MNDLVRKLANKETSRLNGKQRGVAGLIKKTLSSIDPQLAQYTGSLLQDDENPTTTASFKLLPFPSVQPRGNNLKGEKDRDSNEESKHAPVSFQQRAFQSTPNFISALTKIGKEVLSSSDRRVCLVQGLQRLNEQLPASIYLPFVSNSWRNHCVLRICELESRIFQSKSRAPFLICVELFRPEELLISGLDRARPTKAVKKLKKLLTSADR